jgi:Asp/Glu/hydantoin racemase
MRILLVNPNVTEAVTEMMVAEARRAAGPDTEVLPATAPFGVPYIENRAEAALAAHAVLQVLAERAGEADAAVIAAFGDPGLLAARELLEIPVLGLAESAMLTAQMLGRRFSIVCLSSRLRTWYLETVALYGFEARLASVRGLDVPIPDIAAARDQFRARLIEECRRAVDEDDAEVVIMGGGPLAGLAREAAGDIPVPALDGVACAVRLAEMLHGLGARPPVRGSFARPRPKAAEGLAPALTRLIGGE